MAQNLILAECSAIFGQDIVKKATSDIMMPRYAGMFATKQALKHPYFSDLDRYLYAQF